MWVQVPLPTLILKTIFVKIIKKKKKLHNGTPTIGYRIITKVGVLNSIFNFYINTQQNLQIGVSTSSVVNKIAYICFNSNNPKGLLMGRKTINTFSVGSTITYLKIKQGKFIKRNIMGLKIFLNLFRDIITSMYLKKYNRFFLNIIGCNYNTIKLKKTVYGFSDSSTGDSYILFNLKIPFTKKKIKKIKSIKKRIKKKLIKSFLDPMSS